MSPAKTHTLHTLTTLTADLLALLPDLTPEAAPTLARTLLVHLHAQAPEGTEVLSWHVLPVDAPVLTIDRQRIMAFAKRKYPTRDA